MYKAIIFTFTFLTFTIVIKADANILVWKRDILVRIAAGRSTERMKICTDFILSLSMWSDPPPTEMRLSGA
jgi:hypothetical protein